MTHLLNILATWRLMEFIHDEDAPYDAMRRFRQYVNTHRANHPQATRYESFLDELSQAIGCKWCLSVWCGWFVALTTGNGLLTGLAYSAGAILIDQVRSLKG